jgi:hypothetical protein
MTLSSATRALNQASDRAQPAPDDTARTESAKHELLTGTGCGSRGRDRWRRRDEPTARHSSGPAAPPGRVGPRAGGAARVRGLGFTIALLDRPL